MANEARHFINSAPCECVPELVHDGLTSESALKNAQNPHEHWLLGLFRMVGSPSLIFNRCFL